MPFRDDEKRREYYRRYRAKRRAEQPAGERNRRDRERRAAKRRADREALPEIPGSRDLRPHQRDLYDVLESAEPPRLLTIRKGARVGLTTVQLMLADAAASRGEAVGVYAPTMSMAKELARLFVADVAAPAKVEKATAFAVVYAGGGRVVFNWSPAKHFRLYSFDARYGDEWASLPPDMQHEGSPGALLRGRVRSAANPRVCVSASPSATGDALLAQEAEAGLHLEWMLSCRSAARGIRPGSTGSLLRAAAGARGIHPLPQFRRAVVHRLRRRVAAGVVDGRALPVRRRRACRGRAAAGCGRRARRVAGVDRGRGARGGRAERELGTAAGRAGQRRTGPRREAGGVLDGRCRGADRLGGHGPGAACHAREGRGEGPPGVRRGRAGRPHRGLGVPVVRREGRGAGASGAGRRDCGRGRGRVGAAVRGDRGAARRWRWSIPAGARGRPTRSAGRTAWRTR